MKQFKTIDFLSKRIPAGILSIVLVLVSLASIFFQGLNLGLDFTGGIAVELAFEKDADLPAIRSVLKTSPQFANAQVQKYGSNSEVLIKVVGVGGIDTVEISKNLKTLLSEQAASNTFEIVRVDFIGPVVGDELRDQSGMAMLIALFIMLIYVSIRFSTKFAVGAVAALFHDVIITFGFFSLMRLEFDLTVLAGILAVIGYSLNDTIVICDRIRENFKAARMETPASIINEALTQTLGRTIITSLTTLFVLLALFLMGGEMIKGFSIALIVGIVVGTYSSVYVASNMLMVLKISKMDFIEIKPEEAVDDMP